MQFRWLMAFAMSFIFLTSCQNKGSKIEDGFLDGIASSGNFTSDIPFDAGTESKYLFNDTSYSSTMAIDLKNGYVRLKAADQTDDASNSFTGAILNGLQVDPSTRHLRLATTAVSGTLASSWTPKWTALRAYYPMNGNMNDAVGANNGTVTGSITYPTTQLRAGSNSALFPFSSYVTVPHHASLNISGPYTLMAWVKTVGTDRRIITKGNTASGLYFMKITSDGYLLCGHRTTGSALTVTGTTVINDGTWKHVTCVNDGTNLISYVNGVFENWDPTIGSNAIFTANQVLQLGRYTSGDEQYFSGAMDEVAVWADALTADEVAQVYYRQANTYAGRITSRTMSAYTATQTWKTLSALTTLPFFKEIAPSAELTNITTGYSSTLGTLATDLTNVWHLNAATGTTAIDTVGGKNGTLTGAGAFVGRAALFGNGVTVNGSTGYIRLVDGMYNSETKGTIQAWVYPQTQLANGGEGSIFSSASGTDATKTFAFGMYGVSATSMRLRVSARTPNTHFCGSTDIPIQTWSHAVLASDGSTWTMYLNGIPQTLTLCAGTGTNTGAWFNSEVSGTMRYAVGAMMRSSGTTSYLSANFDEIAYWKRALTAPEVLELYRRGSNRIRYQVRGCTTASCATEDADTANGKGWRGAGNSWTRHFTELNNNSDAVAYAGTVKSVAPIFTFNDFTGVYSALNPKAWVQYRALFETDDTGLLCTYESTSQRCSPELKSVTFGPNHYTTTVQSVTTATELSPAFKTLDADGFTETLGINGCSAGTRYSLSADGTTFYGWNGTTWSPSSDYSTATVASEIKANFEQFSKFNAGSGVLRIKTYLKSDGETPCEVDALQARGVN